MNILGINPGHDATAVLLKDGRIEAAIGEERLSRIKGHLGFPYLAIEKIFEMGVARPEEIDLVVFPFLDYLKASPYFTRFVLDRDGGDVDFANELPLRARWAMFRRDLDGRVCDPEVLQRHYAADARRRYREVLDSLGLPCPFKVVEHHTAHASSAYYTSGTDDCFIFTSDGSGDGVSAALSLGRGGEIRRLLETPALHSAGVFYAAVTKFLGFRRHRHEGKITGLAAYGNPEAAYGEMERCLALNSDRSRFLIPLQQEGTSGQGRWRDSLRVLRRSHLWGSVTGMLMEHFRQSLSGATAENVASAAQKRLEDCCVGFIRHALNGSRGRDLVMGGGTFANVRLNQRLLECDGVRRIFIHPNMGDGGTALGAALQEWASILRDKGERLEPFTLAHVFLGPTYPTEEMERELRKSPFRWRYCEHIEREIAVRVAAGKVVARFDGPMEYGPRALGNRSILVNPTDARVNQWLNQRLKRTEFMPFAPVILQEDAPRYFHGSVEASYPCSFMTVTLDATKRCSREAPAVVHIDGTGRPQFVSAESNPGLHRILSEYQKITGLPLMINTSFNMHEEPIVCTPKDALRSFEQGHLDYLALGPFLVEGDENPARNPSPH